MASHMQRRWMKIAVAGTVLATVVALPVQGQLRQGLGKTDAALVVDGVVREVFRSPRQMQTDYLVQIEVQRSEARAKSQATNWPSVPAPGESVYVHVFQRPGVGTRLAQNDSYQAIPAERAQVRAFLTPRAQGGWEGTFPDWFELTSQQSAARAAADPPPMVAEAAAPSAPAEAPSTLGMTVRPMTIEGKFVLRVMSVERGGPAQNAGLEVGDVIVGANGTPLTSAGQLEQMAARADVLPLVVLDVNSGRPAQVEVRTSGRSEGRLPGQAPQQPAPQRSLGIAAEPVQVGLRTALKVTRVEPGSAAEKAGLEVGDVLVQANGAPLTSPDQLAASLHKSGPTLTLTVRDVRSGQDVPVQIELGGPQPPSSLPGGLTPTTPPASTGSRGRLGIVTELAFYNVEAAVKITEVEPGSPAARAGLQPGVLILEVNGKPVLHPNDLADAERSGNALQLTVVDPRSGRKGNVTVNLTGSF